MFIAGLALLMHGCARTQEAFLTVQVCPVTQQSVDQFANIMRLIADSEGLRFVDNSQKTRAKLEAMGTNKTLNIDSSRIIDIHIEGDG